MAEVQWHCYRMHDDNPSSLHLHNLHLKQRWKMVSTCEMMKREKSPVPDRYRLLLQSARVLVHDMPVLDGGDEPGRVFPHPRLRSEKGTRGDGSARWSAPASSWR